MGNISGLPGRLGFFDFFAAGGNSKIRFKGAKERASSAAGRVSLMIVFHGFRPVRLWRVALHPRLQPGAPSGASWRAVPKRPRLWYKGGVANDPRHILVIDDEEAICFAFARYFERRGFTVTVAGTGKEGERRFAEARPDIVFLDVRLPDANGLDVLERLRQIDARACVVVITAYGTLETVTRAIRGKAFDYLVKPLDLDRAGQIVAEALASRAAADSRPPQPPARATSPPAPPRRAARPMR